MYTMETQSLISLSTLFCRIPTEILSGTPVIPMITGIAMDNRQVQPGNLFVAMKGGSVDGHDFIPDAIQRGQRRLSAIKPLSGFRTLHPG